MYVVFTSLFKNDLLYTNIGRYSWINYTDQRIAQ